MSNALQRALGVFEALSTHPNGRSVSDIANHLNIPPSAAHRLLNDLIGLGYVRQSRNHGDYALTIKLATIGLGFLSRSGIIAAAQPVLDELAGTSAELARLSVVDGDDLVWVARAQGATSGLRYDPNRDNSVAHLASTATGQAWLLTMSNEEALMRVARQGFGHSEDVIGPNAPQSSEQLLAMLNAARERGFSTVFDSFTVGMAAAAAPVRRLSDGMTIGAVSVAGPNVRLTPERLLSLGPVLLEAASKMAATTISSQLFPSAGG